MLGWKREKQALRQPTATAAPSSTPLLTFPSAPSPTAPPIPPRSFDFELLDPVPDADYDSMVIGPKPCRVKYVRRKLSA